MNGEFFVWEGGTAQVGPVDLGFRTFVTDSTAIPEPITATLGLMGLGVLGLMTRRRAA